jgi:hypothetical protein
MKDGKETIASANLQKSHIMNLSKSVRLPSSSELVNLWESGRNMPPPEKAVLLLQSAFPDSDDYYTFNTGKRNELILRFRERLFGSHFNCIDTCSQCMNMIEFEFTVSDLLKQIPENGQRTMNLVTGTYNIEARLPDTRDIISVLTIDNPAEADRALLNRCILSAARDGNPLEVRDIPPPVIVEIEKAMEEADPLSNIAFSLTCDVCSNSWNAVFDIVCFIWEEISQMVKGLLKEVHILAEAYGWSEDQILRLSPFRRQFYIECIGGL